MIDLPDPQVLAEHLTALKLSLPPGGEMVVFVILDAGGNYETGLLATIPPGVFAPILRTWLTRYDAGEATGFQFDA